MKTVTKNIQQNRYNSRNYIPDSIPYRCVPAGSSSIPGTSRSGATIIGGLVLGLARTVAAEFTFYLAVPVMFGASLIKVLKFGLSFTANETSLLIIGMVTAFIVSLVVIKFLMGYIKKHDFKVFMIYRILLAIIVLLSFLFI